LIDTWLSAFIVPIPGLIVMLVLLDYLYSG